MANPPVTGRLVLQPVKDCPLRMEPPRSSPLVADRATYPVVYTPKRLSPSFSATGTRDRPPPFGTSAAGLRAVGAPSESDAGTRNSRILVHLPRYALAVVCRVRGILAQEPLGRAVPKPFATPPPACARLVSPPFGTLGLLPGRHTDVSNEAQVTRVGALKVLESFGWVAADPDLHIGAIANEVEVGTPQAASGVPPSSVTLSAWPPPHGVTLGPPDGDVPARR